MGVVTKAPEKGGGRFEMRPGMHKPKKMRGGLLFLTIVGALFYYAYFQPALPFLSGGGYDVRAIFHQVDYLKPVRTPVRVHGIDVGEVKSFARVNDGKDVEVVMHIDDGSGFKLTSNASAQVYWRTLLGFQYYIQIDPGSSSQPLGNSVIPLSRTGNQVEVDQALSALTPPARGGIQQLFDQLSIGFAKGTQAGTVIDRLAPSMAKIGPALDALRANGRLSNTIVQANRLVSGLVSSDNQLSDLMDKGATTFQATASRQTAIDQILQQGGQTLQDTQTTMAQLDHTLNILDPVTENLRPGARALGPASTHLQPALEQLVPLLNDARPTLISTRPAVTNLAIAGRAGTPFLKQLSTTMGTLNKTVLPSFNTPDPQTGLKLYEAVGPTFATVANSAAMYDANGHVQRFHALAGGANLLGFVPCTLGQNPITDLKISCSGLNTLIGKLLGTVPTTASAATTGATH